jgi:hypothetical protein
VGLAPASVVGLRVASSDALLEPSALAFFLRELLDSVGTGGAELITVDIAV